MCTMARPIPLAPPVTKATLRVADMVAKKALKGLSLD
jgi:hypothetical protein